MGFFETILSSFFPARCAGCERSIETQAEVLCASCREKIILPDTLFCAVCEARLPSAKKICHLDTPYLLGSLAPYEDPLVKKMIVKMKFRRLDSIGLLLGKLLAEYVKNLNPQPGIMKDGATLIIPIPLSKERLRERGFNQAAVIARSFSEEIGLPILETALSRIKHTPPQSKTENKKARLENVHGVFSVIEQKAIQGKKIILIDDVSTTGATLRSAARTLKDNGATEIIAFVVAR